MSTVTDENVRIKKRKMSEECDRDLREVKRPVLKDITNQQTHVKNNELEESMTSINQIGLQMPVCGDNHSEERNTNSEDCFCLDDLNVITTENAISQDEVAIMDRESERLRIYNELLEECSPEYQPYLKCVYFCDILEAKFEKENDIYNDRSGKEYKLSESRRNKIIKWVLEICYKLKLRSSTIYLSINIMDSFFFQQPSINNSNETIINSSIEYLGIAAASILLASKFEEESSKYLNNRIYDNLYNILYINHNNNNCNGNNNDNIFNNNTLCKLEEKVITTLRFDIYHPSSSEFLYSFFIINQCKRDEISLSQYLCELTLTEYSLLNYKSSLISSSSLLLSLFIINIHNNNKNNNNNEEEKNNADNDNDKKIKMSDFWNEKMLTLTHYTIDSMKECILIINNLHLMSFNDSNNNIVYQKYNNKNYGFVSKIFEPVDIKLLLDSFII